ncbi:MAG TPA: hypothetical protein EYG35_03245 [Gammaproteobacteria bacterium]|jgi:hypothetical protein|nr:hypothetical protein [Gammaproteobacteria bacterium]
MKKLILVIISFCFLNSPAFSLSKAEIDEVLWESASELNSSLPMMVDEFTRWDNSMYIKYSNIFTYSYTLLSDDISSDFDYLVLKDFFRVAINKFCTNPDTSFLLEYTDIKFTYNNINGIHLFDNEFGKDDCQ